MKITGKKNILLAALFIVLVSCGGGGGVSPRAVGPKQADDLCGVHLVAGVFDDAAFAVVFFEVFGDEHGSGFGFVGLG